MARARMGLTAWAAGLVLAGCSGHSADGTASAAASTQGAAAPTQGAAASAESAAAPTRGAGAHARHPVSGLMVVPLTVTHAGKVHRFQVEVAASGPEQEQGLMFRTAMGPDEGMIFPMERARQASFWMKNTVIPLDIIFVGGDGRISNIAARAIPYDETPLNSKGLAKAVLELNGGRAAQLGIAPGDAVRW